MRAVNLIPLDQRGGGAQGAGRSEGGAYAVLGLLAGLALMALLYGVARHQISSRREKAAAVEAQVQQVQANAAKLAPYTSFIALREQRVQAVSTLVDSRFDWAHAFRELGRVLPRYISISSLEGTVGTGSRSGGSGSGSGGAVASVTPPGAVPTFTINGCAVSQSAVAVALERLRLIDGASAVTLQSSTKAANSSGSGGSGGSGACPNGDPAFTAQLTFDPLPSASATSSATTTPASSAGGSRAAKPAGSVGGT
jgi:Tfp pilus assembly protein PilN